MSIVPALDLAEQTARAKQDEGMPSSYDAETALLGILLYDYEAFHTLPAGLTHEAFFDPLNGQIFYRIANAFAAGQKPDLILIGGELAGSTALQQLGGNAHLGHIYANAPPSIHAADYAAQIMELHTRRKLIHLGEWITAGAKATSAIEGGSAEIISQTESTLLSFSMTDRRLELVDASTAVADVLAYVDDKEASSGSKIGLNPLDIQIGPLAAGDLLLLGGRPSMGKSALAGHIGLRIAAPEWWATYSNGSYEPLDEFERRRLAPARGVIELNGEMSVPQMTRRHLTDIGHNLFGERFPTFKQIRDKAITAEHRDLMESASPHLAAMPIKMLKRTGLKVSQLRSIARRQTSEWARQGIETGAVIIDHVGLLRPEGRSTNRYQDQMEIAIAMKELADELQCPVFALIQLSREVERRDDKRPQLSDLRDAGGWEENADCVIFPFRDSYYAQREKEPDARTELLKWDEWDRRRKSMTMEAIIAKLREGDAGHTAELWASLAWNAIRSSAPEFVNLL